MIDFTNIPRKIDIILGIMGALVGAIFLVLGFVAMRTLLMFGVLLLLSCGIYLIMRKKWLKVPEQVILEGYGFHVNKSIFHLLSGLFFILFAYSLYTLKTALYVRPVGYFVATIVMSAIIAAEIFVMSKDAKNHVWLILLKIFILGISLRASVYYEFPGYVGADPWAHSHLIELLLNLGHVAPPTPDIYSPQSYYAYFPIFHILGGVTSLLTGLNIKNALFMSTGLFEIISLIFVFLIGKRYFNQRIGLLAALLLCINYHHVRWGFWIIPMTLGLGLTLLIIYIMGYKTKERTQKYMIFSILMVLFFLLIIPTHTLTSVVVFSILALMYIAQLLYNALYVNVQKNQVTLSFLVMVLTSMLAYWIYASRFFETTVASFIRRLFTMELLIEVYIVEQGLGAEVLDKAGFFVFFALAIIGSLYILSWNVQNKQRFTIPIVGGLLALFIFTTEIGKISTLLPHRWFSFVELLLTIPMVIGICLVSRHKNIRITFISFVLLTLFISSCMFVNSVANPDGSMQSINSYAIRLALTESEMQSAKTISEKCNGSIGVDSYINYFLQTRNIPTISITQNLMDREYMEIPAGIILIRKYILNNAFYGRWEGRRGITELTHNPIDDLNMLGYDRIYDCGSVYGYYRGGSAINE